MVALKLVHSNDEGNISVAEYSNLESNVQATYSEIETVTYQKIERTESATEREGWTVEVREELVNVLDEHGQLQWENHPTETEKAYKIRYLTSDGQITDESNAVHIAAFVGCRMTARWGVMSMDGSVKSGPLVDALAATGAGLGAGDSSSWTKLMLYYRRGKCF